ncbi:MAG: ABC transporter ATP-binding protein [Pseudomonadota bacterium]
MTIQSGISINNLVVGYSKQAPVNREAWHINIKSGELIAIIGPNGSGKTSLLRALMGDRTYQSGEIFVWGEKDSVESWSAKKLSRYFSYLPQETFFEPLQETEAYLKLAFLPRLGLFGQMLGDDHSVFENIVTDLSLHKFLKKRLQDLSSGERQKIFLARALLQTGPITLLDEPTNHLDPNIVETTWRLLKRKKGQKTMIVATHDLTQVERHCDQIIVLSKENLVFSGSIAEYQSLGIKQIVFPLIDLPDR